jgi:hypothetical protein
MAAPSVPAVIVAAAALLASLLAAPGVPAARAATPVGPATPYSGLAFDTCTAPSASRMRAWLASPYRAVGVYISGINRACRQPNLTADWVSAVTRDGWRILPIAVGRQAPCATRRGFASISPSIAREQGAAAADQAATAAGALGILPGSALYLDIEDYRSDDGECRRAVLRYVSGWSARLRARGYLAGVYAGARSGAAHLSASYAAANEQRPDALWLARWDGSASLTGWPGVPDRQWSARQRVKQHVGDHYETHGGVRMLVDANAVDAPVATVAVGYPVTVRTSLNSRLLPTTASPVLRRLPAGSSARVVCQTSGQAVGSATGGSTVWNRLADGSFVSGRYVATPAAPGFSVAIPRCLHPSQVTASSLIRRSGPSRSATRVGALPLGSLAWSACRVDGAVVDGVATWHRLSDGSFVAARYLAGHPHAPIPC